MKKVEIITDNKYLNKFLERKDINIISVDVKSVEQSSFAQEYFVAAVFYEDCPQSSVKPSVDWEQMRYEISRDALSAHLASEEFVFRRNDYKEVAKQAICFADELIKQLKGEQQ